jgi:hypothetical protein
VTGPALLRNKPGLSSSGNSGSYDRDSGGERMRMNVITAGYAIVSIFFAIYAPIINLYVKADMASFMLYTVLPFTVLASSWVSFLIEYLYRQQLQLTKYRRLGRVVRILPVYSLYLIVVWLIVAMWVSMFTVAPSLPHSFQSTARS